VIGVEVSPTMIARARKSFCTHLEKKRLDLIHASVENMPLAANSVDGVVTINTHYF
jgi:ubiquinone/menaquinone biosynthesis C-methylase UbiE